MKFNQKWLKELFEKKDLEFREWKTDNSILKFLSSKLNDKGSLLESSNDLPDELMEDGNIKFAAGLVDAMFGADDSADSKKRIAELSKHFRKIAKVGDKSAEQEFYQLITENINVIGIIDLFLQTIVDESLPVQPYLFKFAKDLATQTDKRNSVKFGIAILGLCQDKSVLNDIKILGLHDEFTVYSSVAIINLSSNVEEDLWELAKKVDGWGKIQLVDRLSKLELSEPIKDWLIEEGYKNNIMYEYLAYTCAVNGELHKKLVNEEVKLQIFKSAAEIIDALIVEHSPAEDITVYSFAAQVIQDFIRHTKTQSIDISNFNVLNKIKDFLIDLQKDIGEQAKNGWNDDVISNCIIDIIEIINSRDWKTLAYEGLKSNNNVIYWNAKQAAEKLEIDLWETVWSKLQVKPVDSSSWHDVIQYGKPENSDQIINFALRYLPFDELSTGPKDTNGFGDDYNKHASLECVTTFLGNYPQKGEKIILASLKSPVTRNRNAAVNVLDKWKRQHWSSEIEKEIQLLQDIEPNIDTKENIGRLLSGQELK